MLWDRDNSEMYYWGRWSNSIKIVWNLEVHGVTKDIVVCNHLDITIWNQNGPQLRQRWGFHTPQTWEWSIINFYSSFSKMPNKSRPESSIFDHLSKFFLGRKLPDTLNQVLIRVPVTSQHLKHFISNFHQKIIHITGPLHGWLFSHNQKWNCLPCPWVGWFGRSKSHKVNPTQE